MSEYLRGIRSRIGRDLLLIPAVAALVRNDHGQILLQRRPDGSWSLPAGSIEPGETPAQAVEREALEETGLRVRAQCVAGVFGGAAARVVYANGDQVEYVVTVFECAVVGGALDVTGDETIALRFVDSSKVQSMLQFAYPPEILDTSRVAAYFQEQAADDRGTV
jgi:8-oxo-dGTP pyrophosphatase MutT (NUDIX family)